ncbi:MAG: fumarylacetoacetate hydrolase family protein [Oscillospiraceae bacterium]|jgi:2-keto-4-pentenoate hydratase/2-oxohepta-3-ene-1,7-dioic acid hydratase in catechol pathway|nr:fumarylacetoacetate hydrolase family protein [Oscillospiraceae bacterium]
MKFCGFYKDGSQRLGVAGACGGIIDITAMGFPDTLDEVIAGGAEALARVKDAVDAYKGRMLGLEGLEFANVTRPGKIVCVGLNYKSHAEETGGAAPERPVLFNKFNDALCPSGASVELPQWQRCYDYEAELVAVVGARAYNVAPEDAGRYIFGYTCGNDLSARDCQFLTGQWLSGKSFPGFAPAGPFVVTGDSFDPCGDNEIICRVNGARVQRGVTSDMIFTCAETLSAASRYFRLEPGDLIFTGTPAGVILGKPKGTRTWLRPGDTVEVEIEGIGTLVTRLTGVLREQP